MSVLREFFADFMFLVTKERHLTHPSPPFGMGKRFLAINIVFFQTVHRLSHLQAPFSEFSWFSLP
jgi:hypothetical protein